MTLEKLRFAPLIRVSTEKQADRGESLKVQQKSLVDVVKKLGGIIPEECWSYCGQEHATPSYERKMMDELLLDSSKNKFDAVIVFDLSRWSRDNSKSKAGLQILKANNIKFFVRETEYDLNDPEKQFVVGLFTEMNEFFASSQAHKSIISRIARAKKNMPSSGKLPFGRTYDSKFGWGIDNEKKKDIEKAAELYLKGGKMPEIAKMLNMNHSVLHKILTKKSGPDWPIHFKNERFDIDEIVTLNVPELLPQEIIQKILQKCYLNKTFTHGEIKYKYLLGRMIFCKHCGYAMFGQRNHSKKRYYRHSRNGDCNCKSGYLPAKEIEDAVMVHVFSTCSDVKGIERAIKNAIPDKQEYKKLMKDEAYYIEKMAKAKRKKKKLLSLYSDSELDEDDNEIIEMINDTDRNIREFENSLGVIKNKMATMPSEKQIKENSRKIKRVFNEKFSAQLRERTIESYHSTSIRYHEMTYDEKKELLQVLFSGKNTYGNRNGVYVWKDDKNRWNFEIRGTFGNNIIDILPMTKSDASALLGIEDENINPFSGAVLNDVSQCHAYNCFCFYQ